VSERLKAVFNILLLVTHLQDAITVKFSTKL